MLEGILAGLAPAWQHFAAAVRDLDCRPRMVQLEIDGLVYTSVKWPCRKGLDIWPRLTALLGPGLEAAIVQGRSLGDVGIGAIVRVATAAMDQGLWPLVVDTLASMSVNQLADTSKPGEVVTRLDDHFAGEYEHLARVCIFALVHNLRGPTRGAR